MFRARLSFVLDFRSQKKSNPNWFWTFLFCERFTGIHYAGETGSIIQDSVNPTLKFHSELFEHICRSFTFCL